MNLSASVSCLGRFCLGLFAVLLFASQTGSQEDERVVVLFGEPFQKCETFPEKSTNYELSDKESKEYQVQILKKRTKGGEEYVWQSREGRLLHYTVSGDWHIFHAKDGSGYVKVLAVPGEEIVFYMEHIHLQWQTITYWGKAVIGFSP